MTTTRSRPVTAKDGAEASAMIQKNARTRRPTRATTKSGNTTEDRAAREAAAALATVAKGLTPEEKTIAANEQPLARHQALLMKDGAVRVHKMGCRDVARDLRNSQCDAPMAFEWASELQAATDFWSDHIEENWDPALGQVSPSPAWLEGQGFVLDFKPCCDLIPMPVTSEDGEALEAGPILVTAPAIGTVAAAVKAAKPKRAPKPKAEPKAEAKVESAAVAARRAAKRDLARRVLLAAEAMLSNLDGSELASLGMTQDEARVCVSQWVHHLPVRDSAEAVTWWPQTMPKPDRSDWR